MLYCFGPLTDVIYNELKLPFSSILELLQDYDLLRKYDHVHLKLNQPDICQIKVSSFSSISKSLPLAGEKTE
ncbi:MAG: hypothetical protein CM15mP22_1140 [Gammaproteobacteria bacterium]|nr:MAG: hypothetical protein CM15mP22_1140 [Gammaproteobacteria bacterium]